MITRKPSGLVLTAETAAASKPRSKKQMLTNAPSLEEILLAQADNKTNSVVIHKSRWAQGLCTSIGSRNFGLSNSCQDEPMVLPTLDAILSSSRGDVLHCFGIPTRFRFQEKERSRCPLMDVRPFHPLWYWNAIQAI
mmetsp:Transcript_13324/g.31991  ORF Transcript_13324/g.31991 Transcript_13324/m.31991 type:complete len:137 (+) Transcript_13324:181-591(+)